MWTALLSLMSKELRQTVRDKRMLWLLTVAPLIQLIVFGYAVNLEVERVPTVVADEDRTPESRKLAAELTAGDAFLYKGTVGSGTRAARMIARGEIPLALIIPRGYARRRAQGKPVAVQALVDGGDSNRAIVASNAVMSFALRKAAQQSREQAARLAAAQGRAPALPITTVVPRILYNPTLNSKVYFVPGIAATLLLIVTLIVTAMGLAREKEMGTLEQVMVTPIRPEILILGKTLPYGFIGLLDLGFVIGLGAAIFDVPVRGALWIVFGAGILYMLTTLGMGLLVSTLARTQQQALMGAILFVMPSILLSGFITPVENMPDWLRPLSVLTPVRHFVEVLRGVLLKSSTFPELASQFVALAGLGLCVFATSAWLLRRRLA